MNPDTTAFSLAIELSPSAADVQAVRDGLETHNRLHAQKGLLVELLAAPGNGQ